MKSAKEYIEKEKKNRETLERVDYYLPGHL